jgi:hypothetical protein
VQAMVREGETLSQTFNSLAQSMATYYQLFYTEEENLARNTEMLRKQFEAMGLVMPASREAFKAMVEAALKAGEDGAATARWLLEMAGIMDQVLPPLEEFTDQIEEVGDSVVAVTQLIDASLNQNVRPWESVFNNYYAGRQGRQNIGDYLNGLMSGPMSPLDPMGKFNAAEADYNRVLGLAQGGDIDAIMKLPSVHSTMIEIARSIWGSSSPFVALFERTFNEVAGVGEVADFNSRMLAIQTDALQYHAQVADAILTTNALLTRIAEKSSPVTADSWGDR